jgi:ankyrin repeat protein
MGYLTNLFKNKFNIPKIPINQIIKTSNVASAYAENNFTKIDKLLKKGKYYYKSIKFKENNEYSFLHQSILDSNRHVVDIILKQSYVKDKDVIEDIDNDLGFAPIHLACAQNDVEIIRDLINIGGSGIDVKTKTDNLSLLHVCAQFGSLKTFEFIYKNYYYKNIDILTEEKWSPFHFATFMNRFDISSLLIDNKADLYLRNKQFLTPLETSILNDNCDLFMILYKFHYDLEKLNSYENPEVKILLLIL